MYWCYGQPGFFRWLSAWWGFFSSCLCFAAPAADEVRPAWRASPTVAIPPLGWRDPASAGLYSDPNDGGDWLSL
jgi:hypothetical protein